MTDTLKADLPVDERLSWILTRTSAVTLKEPGPAPEDLSAILKAGTRAPDHGKLEPWRFVVIEGEARGALGDVMAADMKSYATDSSEIELKRERDKVFRAPTIIVVGAKIIENKIPAIEQEIAAACAGQNILLAAHALGYGTMWKTGAPAYSPAVKRFVGLEPADKIVGFIYLGTADVMPKAYRPTRLDGVVKRL